MPSFSPARVVDRRANKKIRRTPIWGIGMRNDHRLTRRSTLLGAAGVAAAGLVGGPGIAAAFKYQATPQATPISRVPLWQTAWQRGIVFGTSAATWQLEDPDYAQLVEHEAAILFTEDDLLWWRLRPTPDSELDFQFADQFIAFAERNRQLVLGAHLVWDEGFGEEWTEDDLWGMDEETARRLLFETVEQVVGRYRGRVAGWIVVNEAIDAHEQDGYAGTTPGTRPSGPPTPKSPSISPTTRIPTPPCCSTSSGSRPTTSLTVPPISEPRRYSCSTSCSTPRLQYMRSGCRRTCRRMASPRSSTWRGTSNSSPRLPIEA